MQSICKQEAAHRPCPRIILVCCTHLVTGGLSAEGLFQKDAPDDLVHYLLGAFEEGAPLSEDLHAPLTFCGLQNAQQEGLGASPDAEA